VDEDISSCAWNDGRTGCRYARTDPCSRCALAALGLTSADPVGESVMTALTAATPTSAIDARAAAR
jgi:hypothetical protein